MRYISQLSPNVVIETVTHDNNQSLPRNISPILSLKNSRCLMHLNRVPSSLRHLDTKHAVPGANPKPGSLYKLSLVRSSLAIIHRPAGIHASHLLIEHPVQTSLQANHRLASLEVPMNRHTRAHVHVLKQSIREARK